MKKQTLGIIGIGAFGEFMLKHVIPHFEVRVHDSKRDLSSLAEEHKVTVHTLAEVCASDILVLCVPVSQLATVAAAIKPLVHAGQLVIDLCSVKCLPVKILKESLPNSVELLSLHPLFGPQSGRMGIAGLNVAVCNVSSTRVDCVKDFLTQTLGLKVHETTPELHDEEMAYVQGLTHMIAKIFTFMDIPEIHQKTKTYMLLDEMVEMIRYDSEELFNAIQRDNPYVEGTKQKFFEAVKALEERLNQTSGT